jgi:hypothetical protein
MQQMYPRTNPAPIGASENSIVISVPQIEEALRECVGQNAAHIRHEPENTSPDYSAHAGGCGLRY